MAGRARRNGPSLPGFAPATSEDFAVALDYTKRGKTVGEPTGGNTGQPLFFYLPGGGTARVCTKRDTYPDNEEFVCVGVQPHINAHRTVEDVRADRDTVLEVALAELRKTNWPGRRRSRAGMFSSSQTADATPFVDNTPPAANVCIVLPSGNGGGGGLWLGARIYRDV